MMDYYQIFLFTMACIALFFLYTTCWETNKKK
ncbi:putative membrane protein [Bacillus cereus]|nr:putative membrane protein [Bacillus cereus]